MKKIFIYGLMLFYLKLYFQRISQTCPLTEMLKGNTTASKNILAECG